MDRLMVLKLQARGCGAEAWMNGLPVARLLPGQATVSVAVHEYALAGPNRFKLVLAPEAGATPPVTPKPAPEPAARPCVASLHLLLPRMGNAVDEQHARTLAHAEAVLNADDGTSLPLARLVDVDLPVGFPRWRWTEAPLVDTGPASHATVLAALNLIVQDLLRGQTASFLAATRLRTEELALAYQREPAAETARLQAWLDALHQTGRATWQPLVAATLRLRAVADNRLLEGLGVDGAPALRTAPDPDGNIIALPLRLALVDGRAHVLR